MLFVAVDVVPVEVVVVTGAPGAKRFPPVGLRFFSVGVTECDDVDGPSFGVSLLQAPNDPMTTRARTPTPTPKRLRNKMNHPLSSYLIGWQRSAASPIGQLQDRDDEPASFDQMRTKIGNRPVVADYGMTLPSSPFWPVEPSPETPMPPMPPIPPVPAVVPLPPVPPLPPSPPAAARPVPPLPP